LPALWHCVDPPTSEQSWSAGVAAALGAAAIATAAAPAAKTGVTQLILIRTITPFDMFCHRFRGSVKKVGANPPLENLTDEQMCRHRWHA
jgi:hypothetical protein